MEQWLGIRLELPYSVLCPSRPGYDKTSIDGGETPRAQSDLIWRLVNDLFPNRPIHLIGFNIGCWIALRMAHSQPERVRSVTLLSPIVREQPHRDILKFANIDKLKSFSKLFVPYKEFKDNAISSFSPRLYIARNLGSQAVSLSGNDRVLLAINSVRPGGIAARQMMYAAGLCRSKYKTDGYANDARYISGLSQFTADESMTFDDFETEEIKEDIIESIQTPVLLVHSKNDGIANLVRQSDWLVPRLTNKHSLLLAGTHTHFVWMQIRDGLGRTVSHWMNIHDNETKTVKHRMREFKYKRDDEQRAIAEQQAKEQTLQGDLSLGRILGDRTRDPNNTESA
eukprot:GHVL01044142.1.p1 GENE.GHVL01044142.1~~GHVL01044142.1.p1  ORF type:complete len:340 (+),score=39.36 GHVL01044142.1:380-1399(+)